MTKPRFWTEERDALLAEMWPTHSGSQIGAVLGCGRGAVIGRYHRLIGTEFLSTLVRQRDDALRKRANEEKRQAKRELLKAQIEVARRRGLSYRAIGTAMGISQAAAWRREHGYSP